MSKYIKILIISLITTYSCSKNNKLEKNIKDYEQANYHINVLNIKLNQSAKPFYYSDSIKIIQKAKKEFIKHKMYELNTQLKEINKRLDTLKHQRDNCKQIPLAKMISGRIKYVKKDKQKLLSAIERYKDKPQTTQIQQFDNLIESYSANPNKIIGFSISARIKFKEGDLPTTKTDKIFLIDSTQTTVLGVLN